MSNQQGQLNGKVPPIFALIGNKIGMSQVFDQSGNSFAATIIEIPPNLVVEELTLEKRAYSATKLGFGQLKEKHYKREILGRYKHLPDHKPPLLTKEFREMSGFKVGTKIGVENFAVGDIVSVSAKTKGKGFAGPIKRHNQHIGPRSHGGGGGTKPIRQVGSLGDISGNKVFKGMKMPGRHGGKQATIKNLVVIATDPKLNLLLVKGSIPGPKRAIVFVKKQLLGQRLTRTARDLVPLV